MVNKKTNLKRIVLSGGTIIEKVRSNAAGGESYKIQDASEKLIAVVGANMFNEPTYYPKVTEMEDGKYEQEGLSEQAKLVINTAIDVAESDSPRDLVAVAHWARKEMKLRTTPQILLAIAAASSNTKQYVRNYTPKIIQRADELKQVFEAYRNLFGYKKSLPNSLKKGLADSFAKFGERDFLKYEGKGRPKFSDILRMIDRRKDYPVSQPIRTFLYSGTVTEPKKIPIIAARKALYKKTEFDSEAKNLARISAATWETLCSVFGNKKEIWEYLIDNESLPYMATIRNLRNMSKINISDNHVAKVCQKIVKGAVKSKMLPFRFRAAHRFLKSIDDTQSRHVDKFREALSMATDEIVQNMPRLPGKSIVASDTSMSMTQPISDNSKMTLLDAGAILAAMITRNSEEGSIVGAFANLFVPISSDHSVLDLAEEIASTNVGYGTNTTDVIKFLQKNNIVVDRIVILSDMQCYGENYHGGQEFSKALEKYRKDINPNCKLHSFDLSSHGESMTKQGDINTNLVAGFSEKLLDTVLRFEGITETGEKVKREFTIEYIRKNF